VPRQEPAVDGEEPAEDQGHARERGARHPLVEEQRAQQQRGDRDEQRHQHHVGRPHRGEQAEVDQEAERGAEQRSPGFFSAEAMEFNPAPSITFIFLLHREDSFPVRGISFQSLQIGV